MTDDQTRALLMLAIDIACDPPEKAKRFTPRAYVSWQYINEMRALLDQLDIDWRAVVRGRERASKDRRESFRRQREADLQLRRTGREVDR